MRNIENGLATDAPRADASAADAAEAAAFDTAARRYRALGEPTRLRMLQLLADRALTVTDLAVALEVSLPTASRHLALLAAAHLVERRRRGVYVMCRLTSAGTAALDDAAGVTLATRGPPVPRVVAGLMYEDPGNVRLYLHLGAALLRWGGRHRSEWDARMIRDFGDAIRPQLDVLRTAALRIARGESLEGLPVPPEVLVEDFGGVALVAGDALPAAFDT
ncbi:MAG: metalloregulator ArsR/SmtB family transcription factor [Gemmatimonadota bacterium]